MWMFETFDMFLILCFLCSRLGEICTRIIQFRKHFKDYMRTVG